MNDNEANQSADGSNTLLTHKDIALALEVSIATIKHYRNKFPEFIIPASSGKPLLFEPHALNVCKAIRKGFANGLSIQAIRSLLFKAFQAAPPAGHKQPAKAKNNYSDQASLQIQENLLKAVRDMNDHLKEILERQTAFEVSLSRIADKLELSSAEIPLGNQDFEFLVHRLEMAVSGRPLSFPPIRKIIRVRNSYGDAQEYIFDLETSYKTQVRDYEPPLAKADDSRAAPPPVAPPPVTNIIPTRASTTQVTEATTEQSDTTDKEPSAAFMNLPLVILSGQGDFLGAAGKAHGTFTLSDFQALLKKNITDDGHFELQWEKRPDGWILIAKQMQLSSSSKAYDMHIQQTKTPKGNTVALVQKMYVDSRLVPTVYLYTFIKQISDAAARRTR